MPVDTWVALVRLELQRSERRECDGDDLRVDSRAEEESLKNRWSSGD